MSGRWGLVLLLPWQGRLNTTVSWSRMRQDDDLLAPTVNSGSVGISGLNEVDLDQWNQPAALPRSKADAEVDTLLVNARLRLRPWSALRLGADFRYYDQDNRTRYTAFNPSAVDPSTGKSGQIGYIAEDGAHNVLTPFSRVFVPNVGNDDFRYRSSPHDYWKLHAQLSADYRVLRRTTLGARFRGTSPRPR